MKNTLRHLIASTSFRFTKALSNADENFPNLSLGSGVRTPLEIVHHMSAVVQYATYLLSKKDFVVHEITNWKDGVDRFYTIMEKLDAELESGSFDNIVLKRIIQGPVADALTHIGQLAMMSRMNNAPIEKMNYSKADIIIGKIRGY
jgi:hypothetical protein